jgi:hypothetical protein
MGNIHTSCVQIKENMWKKTGRKDRNKNKNDFKSTEIY